MRAPSLPVICPATHTTVPLLVNVVEVWLLSASVTALEIVSNPPDAIVMPLFRLPPDQFNSAFVATVSGPLSDPPLKLNTPLLWTVLGVVLDRVLAFIKSVWLPVEPPSVR